jgi:hypothetical protein
MAQYDDINAAAVSAYLNAAASASGDAGYARTLANAVAQWYVTQNVRVTNNRANWQGGYTQANVDTYTALAQRLDLRETNLLMTSQYHPGESDNAEAADAGLMATLVASEHAGNCDDIAAFVADACLRLAQSRVVVAIVSSRLDNHSFVVLQSQRGGEQIMLDCWVPRDRVVSWGNSLWNRNGATFAMDVYQRSTTAHPGLIVAWDAWVQQHPGPRAIPAATTRADQVGSYDNPTGRRSGAVTPPVVQPPNAGRRTPGSYRGGRGRRGRGGSSRGYHPYAS